MTNDNETEADGLRAGKLRLLKVRQQYQTLTGQTHGLLPLPNDMPWTTSSELDQQAGASVTKQDDTQIVKVTPDIKEASSRLAEVLARRRAQNKDI
jgi:hypothetical protein